MGALEKFLHDTSLPPLIQIAMAHYQFEAIHPFLDGNGRVGRLLITLFLIEREVLPSPLLYLSAFFEATRQEYYRLLRRVGRNGEWEAWLEYFLRGVTRQAEDALRRARAINEQLATWKGNVSGTPSKVPGALVELLAENPYWSTRGVASRLEVAFTTAQRAISRLVEAGILEEVSGQKRDRVFCARVVLNILEEPVRLNVDPVGSPLE